MVDEDGLCEDVERRGDVVAVVVDGRGHGAVVQDDGHPHARADCPRADDPPQRVAELHARRAVVDRPVEGAVAVVREQENVQRADRAAGEVDAHPHGAEAVPERPQAVHRVDGHRWHDEQADEAVGDGKREHVHAHRRVQLLLSRDARHHGHVDRRRDERQRHERHEQRDGAGECRHGRHLGTDVVRSDSYKICFIILLNVSQASYLLITGFHFSYPILNLYMKTENY